MRAALALLAVLLSTQATALAGRTGQARSVEVLAKRTAASPRGAHEWGGKAATFTTQARKQARGELRGAAPGAEAMWAALGRNEAAVQLRTIVGKHLGLTPGQLASKDRRHDRAIKKQLRRMLRQVRTARASGVPVGRAFPGSLAASHFELEQALTYEIAKIDRRQVESRRTSHDAN